MTFRPLHDRVVVHMKAGIKIVQRALEAPIRQIAENASLEGSIVVGKISDNGSSTYGFDAQVEEYGDLVQAGTENGIRITAELPGVTEQDIDISLDDDVLTIRGEKKFERTDDKENFHFVERSYGTFQRSLRLPYPVDPERVQASFENGVLTVTVPKTGQQERSRRIQVQGRSSGGQASQGGQGASGRTGGGGSRGGQGGAPGSTPGGAST